MERITLSSIGTVLISSGLTMHASGISETYVGISLVCGVLLLLVRGLISIYQLLFDSNRSEKVKIKVLR